MKTERTKILAIDDNKDNLVSLKTHISDAIPYARIYTALNGEKGLELSALRNPDMILLNLSSTCLDGFMLCNKLKSDKKLCEIPVIFVTPSNSDKESRVRALECGAEAFLTTPIDKSELTLLIRAMVKIKTSNIRKLDENERRYQKLNITLEQRVIELTAQLEASDTELRNSHAELNSLFESLPGLYMVLTRDLKIVSVSDAYLKATLTLREDILGRDLFEVFPDNPDDPGIMAVSNIQASIDRVIRNAATDNMSIARHYIRRPDGVLEEHYWNPINSPMFGADGQIKYIIHRVEEVTELMRQKSQFSNLSAELVNRELQMKTDIYKSSQELRVTNQQLKAVNKDMEAFSYSVSHDLRSPLRHINGFAEILVKKYSDHLPEDARNHLNTIIASSLKMGTLIDDLLSFSRTGRVELKKSSLKMNQVVEDAISFIKPSFTDRKVVWNISALPEVYGDYNLLRLVWVNLLDNAVKYTQTRETSEIRIGYKEEKNELIFFIQDNGVGFDMKYAQKLFGVFQRLHSSAQFDGTGIGLANVNKIILRHGGRTWAEAETDKGATFYFSIPKEMDDKP